MTDLEIIKELEEKLKAPFSMQIGGKVYPAHQWKVQRNYGGDKAHCIAYIDKSQVAKRLDECFGVLGWMSESRENSDKTKTCTISVKHPITGEWISKDDVGTPTKVEAEKGASSDAFKRAAARFGIGAYLAGKEYHISTISVNGKPIPCTKDGKPLHSGKQLTAYINGFTSSAGLLVDFAKSSPEIWAKYPILSEILKEIM